MRVGNVAGRSVLVTGEGVADIEHGSGGRFPADPARLFDHWAALVEWSADYSGPWKPVDTRNFGCPVPGARQVFGVGANFHAHAHEIGAAVPEHPVVFAKFPSCLAGPYDDIVVASEAADWEVEVVVVIGRPARHVNAVDAWSYIAGLTVGQDISDRVLQMRPKEFPQVTLGKSLPTYGPIGPVVVTPDELPNRDDIELSCSLNGQQMQRASTADHIVDIPTLIAYLSSYLQLLPGDLIFTGSPSGSGTAQQPPRFLKPGDELVSAAGGIGEMRNHCTAPRGTSIRHRAGSSTSR